MITKTKHKITQVLHLNKKEMLKHAARAHANPFASIWWNMLGRYAHKGSNNTIPRKARIFMQISLFHGNKIKRGGGKKTPFTSVSSS